MNIQKRSLLFLVIWIPLSLLLGGCDEFDQQLVLDIIGTWVGETRSLEAAHVYVIAEKAWEQAASEFVSTEEAIQLNGFDVIDDIERADELSKEGLTPENEHLMDEALELRPEDWRIRERDAVLWTMNGNSAATMSAEDISDGLLQEQILRGGDCHALRLQQLHYRELTYHENYLNCEMRANCDMTEYKAAHAKVQAELQELEGAGVSSFCGD